MSPDATQELGRRKLVVGIGSPHGRDQLGWRVAEGLRGHLGADWQLLLARVPLDLLDWIESVQELHLIDASVDIEGTQPLLRLDWPNPLIVDLPCWATHDFNLPRVLQLAASLGILPPRVTLWVIPVGSGPADDPADDPLGRQPFLERTCRSAVSVIEVALRQAGVPSSAETYDTGRERQPHA